MRKILLITSLGMLAAGAIQCSLYRPAFHGHGKAACPLRFTETLSVDVEHGFWRCPHCKELHDYSLTRTNGANDGWGTSRDVEIEAVQAVQ